MLGAAASSGTPPIARVIVLVFLVVGGVASILRGIGAAGTGLAALKSIKSLVSDGQLLAGRPVSGPLRLSGPVDLGWRQGGATARSSCHRACSW